MKQNYTMRSGCLALLMLLSFALYAQPPGSQGALQIKGTIKDSQGVNMPGVNVLEKGTTNGTVASLDGEYQIQVSSSESVLQFVYIGFVTEERVCGNNTVINVSLKEDQQVLDQSVVVGYSIQAKKDITGSVAIIKADDLQKTPASNFGKQMQGKTAGVNIQSAGSAAGGTAIRIRGIGSVNDNGPLYVIDGVSTRNQDINSINPNDIESIQILKDASAASIYGAQASGGVIIITTKKGRKGDGRAKVSYDAYFGLKTKGKFHEMLNTQEYADYLWVRQLNDISMRNRKDDLGNPLLPSHDQFGKGPRPVIPDYIIPTGYSGSDPGVWSETNRITKTSAGTDWWDEMTRTGKSQSHQVSVTGAGESGRYAMGANYYDEQSVVFGEFFKRYSVRANSEYNVRKYIRVGENLSISHITTSYRGNQDEGTDMSHAYRMVPYIPVYDIAGKFAGTGAKESGNAKNPVANVNRAADDRANALRLLGNLYAEVDFLKDFMFKSNFGVDYTTRNAFSMEKLSPEPSEPTKENTLTENGGHNLRWVFTNTLNYQHVFAKDHSIKVLLGTETMIDNIGRNWEAKRKGFFKEDDVNTWVLDNGTRDIRNASWYQDKYAIVSYFGRLDYSYKDRYLLTANIRRDGSSRFVGSNRWGSFAALSGGWRISNENFMQDVSWVDDLKFRIGYGATGNSDIPRAFNYAEEYGQKLENGYDITGSSNSTAQSFLQSKFGNRNTRWESSKMTNVGIDLTVLNNRLDFNIEYYVKKTDGMLVLDNYSPFSGVTSSPYEKVAPYRNIGKMSNKGLDVGINYRGGQRQGLSWEIGGTISTYSNKVESLVEGDPLARLWGATGTRIGDLAVTQANYPISMFYGYTIDRIFQNEAEVLAAPSQQGIDKTNPKLMVGKYKYVDINGDGVIDTQDQGQIGNPHPDFTYGLNLSAEYKNFDFSMYFYGEQGKDIFNFVKYFTDFKSFPGGKSKRALYDSWTPERGMSATLPILDEGDTYSDKVSHSYYVENGSFLKLKNITLGYTIPVASKIGIQRLRVYFQVDNVFTITKYSGLDPEIPNVLSNSKSSQGGGGDLSKGIDMGSSALTRQFLMGVNITF